MKTILTRQISLFVTPACARLMPSVTNKVEYFCTNQQRPQRARAVPDPVWVGSKWLLAFPKVPVTLGTSWQIIFSFFSSFTIRLQWVPDTRFSRETTRLISWPDEERYSCPLQSLLVSLSSYLSYPLSSYLGREEYCLIQNL